MRENFKIFLRDNLTRNSLNGSVALTALEAILIFLLAPHMPPYVPFFNSMPWGQERLTPSSFLFFLPLLFVVVVGINTACAVALYQKYILIARILSLNAFIFVMLGILSYVQLLFLTF